MCRVSQWQWHYTDDLGLHERAGVSCVTDTWQKPCQAFLPLGLMKGSLAPEVPSIFPPVLAIYYLVSYNPHRVTYIFRSKACPGRKNDAFPSHKTPFPLLCWRFLTKLSEVVPNQTLKHRDCNGWSPPCLAEQRPLTLGFQPFVPSSLKTLPWKEEGVEG